MSPKFNSNLISKIIFKYTRKLMDTFYFKAAKYFMRYQFSYKNNDNFISLSKNKFSTRKFSTNDFKEIMTCNMFLHMSFLQSFPIDNISEIPMIINILIVIKILMTLDLQCLHFCNVQSMNFIQGNIGILLSLLFIYNLFAICYKTQC